MTATRDSLWVFGYGSLIFRPPHRFGERQPAFVEGYARRFFQGSTDHRGVPGAPGRVVTLVAEAGARCWGAVYRVPAEERTQTLAELDQREQGGYERVDLDVHLESSPGVIVQGLTYVAPPHNQNYLGPAPLAQIVAEVRDARGPSGTNLEYVLSLARALRELDAGDDHVFELERRLLEGT